MKIDKGTIAFSGFTSDPERIWSALKSFAKAYAASQRPTPNEDESYALFARFLNDALPNAHVREEARRFYAAELQSMIVDERARRNAGAEAPL